MENVPGAKVQEESILGPADSVREQETADSAKAQVSVLSATGKGKSDVRCVMAGVL